MSYVYKFINRCFSTDSSVILIGSAFYKKTNDMLKNLANISSDPNYQALLSNVENDLNTYLGMSQGEVYSTIGISPSNFSCVGSGARKNNNTIINTSSRSNYYDYTLAVSPNPLKTVCNVIINSKIAGSGKIEIVNSIGKVVSEINNVKVSINENIFKLNVSDLPFGYYLCVSIINGKKNFVPIMISNQ